MFKIEDMTNNSSKEKTVDTRDVKSLKSGEKSPEDLGKVNNEVLEGVGVEKGEIKDRAEIINDILQKAKDDNPEVVKTKKENREIVNEAVKSSDEIKRKAGDIANDENPKVETKIETDESKNKKSKEPVAKETEETEQDYKSEVLGRLEDWEKRDDNDKKREEMEEYKNELIRKTRDIKESIEELQDELNENAEKRAEVARRAEDQLKSGVEISKLEVFEREKIKEALKEVEIICKNNLNIARLKYLEKFTEAGDNFDNLMDEHKGEEIKIERLEIMADDAKRSCDYLEDLKGDEEKEAQKEVKGILGRFGDAIRDDPELQKKLIAAGIIAALLVLAAGVGITYGPEIMALVTADNAMKVLAWGGVGASLGVLYWKRKRIKKALGEGGKIGFGGALLVASWFNEKNRDDFVKGVSGMNFPSWYNSMGKILGLNRENESKA